MRITGISLIGIGPKFINMDRDTPLLRPVDLQDWVPQNPLARFLLEAVETLNLLLSLLMERATHENLPIRCLCANTHPDQDTIRTFRRENQALFKDAFVKVLELARRPAQREQGHTRRGDRSRHRPARRRTPRTSITLPMRSAGS